MDLQVFVNSSTGELQFNLETAKRAQRAEDLHQIHYTVARGLNRYLKHKAALKLESDRQAADPPKPEPVATDLIPRSTEERPQSKATKYARLAKGSLSLAHWDLTYYVWSIDNLTSALAASLHRSCRFLAACATAKAAQLYVWPSAQRPLASFGLAALVAYHAAYTVAYLLSLQVIARCRRDAEELKAKTTAETVSQSDVRAWAGLRYQLVNTLSFHRWYRSVFYTGGALWRDLVDFVMSFVLL